MKISETHHRTKDGVIKKNPICKPKIIYKSSYMIKTTYEKYQYSPQGEDTIRKMMEHLSKGNKLPPILINGGELVDGRHRLEAYRRLDKEIPTIEGLTPFAYKICDKSGRELKIKRGNVPGQKNAYEV